MALNVSGALNAVPNDADVSGASNASKPANVSARAAAKGRSTVLSVVSVAEKATAGGSAFAGTDAGDEAAAKSPANPANVSAAGVDDAAMSGDAANASWLASRLASRLSADGVLAATANPTGVAVSG